MLMELWWCAPSYSGRGGRTNATTSCGFSTGPVLKGILHHEIKSRRCIWWERREKGKVAPARLEPTWYQALATLTTEPRGHTGTKLSNSLLISNGGTECLSLKPLGHWACMCHQNFYSGSKYKRIGRLGACVQAPWLGWLKPDTTWVRVPRVPLSLFSSFPPHYLDNTF